MHIRTIITDTPSPTNRLVYGIVPTDNWVGDLYQHPVILNYPDKYEVTSEPIPTDTTIWSIEYHNFEL